MISGLIPNTVGIHDSYEENLYVNKAMTCHKYDDFIATIWPIFLLTVQAKLSTFFIVFDASDESI